MYDMILLDMLYAGSMELGLNSELAKIALN